ncbi:MAG: DedA family protein [Myxococcales bacterium]|nr:DedA family protein [Myxococcales bacterium]MCB9524568.1 DedA family protein [Myxococcales bacterium]
MDWLTGYLEQFTYIGIAVALFLAGLGVPIPEDIPLIFGGVMAGAGKIDIWIHFAISMAFIAIGDSCLYYIGRRIGRSSTTGGFFSKLLTPARRKKAQGYYDRFGSWTVFFGRFVAGIRGAIFLTAGVVNFPFWRFLILDTLAALISVPVWIWLGVKFGENWEVILEEAKSTQGWILAAVAVVVVGAVVAFKVRGRNKAKAEEIEAEVEELKHATDSAMKALKQQDLEAARAERDARG